MLEYLDNVLEVKYIEKTVTYIIRNIIYFNLEVFTLLIAFTYTLEIS